ncbi:MFS transporter [Campylobacter sp. 2018MI01]|uniref:MFS transporter n=1 Tax=Campylobacter sp. 2018MI01 TaxID=2836735 RepID=UPI0020243006|nr:MFS transporter [Campylobacter sp. 2018MI01]
MEKIVNKMYLKIMPLILLMFCLAMLDRSNIAYVKDYIEIDAGISKAAYALGAGIFFIGYAIFEIPSNLLLHKLGAKIWLSRIMITWGLVCMVMIYIKDETSFYILRFLLGLSEAGFSPGVILYLSYFFPTIYRSKAYGFYQLGAPLALMLGGVITGAILDYAPSIWFKNWQWMFIIQGAITVIVGFYAYFKLASKPENAKWLSEEEKAILIAELEKEQNNKEELNSSKALSSIIVWKFVLVYFAIQLSVYGVLFYLPTQVSHFLGTNVGLKVGIISAIPWAVVLIALPIVTSYADKLRAWSSFSIALLLLAVVSMFLSVFINSLALFILFISLAAVGFIAIQPIFWNLPTQILKGTGAAAGIALIGALGNLGGFVAPNLKNYAESQFNSSYAGLIALCLVAFLGVLMLIHLKKSYTNIK